MFMKATEERRPELNLYRVSGAGNSNKAKHKRKHCVNVSTQQPWSLPPIRAALSVTHTSDD